MFRSLQAARQSLMTARGSVTMDARANALLLCDTGPALEDTAY
nr:putative outer membrane porin HofQ [Candidatus Pantoea persica]